jgi:hypothetical protein
MCQAWHPCEIRKFRNHGGWWERTRREENTHSGRNDPILLIASIWRAAGISVYCCQ